ncbi:MAG TPA: hypothetical protein HPP76_08865 [Desulfuromonadales bacterium]|nr:hypothetical protein [Desulfuromonadales bacterium]
MKEDNWLAKLLYVSGTSFNAIQGTVRQMMVEYDLEHGGKPRRYASYNVSSKLIRKAAYKTGAFGGLVSAPATIPGIGTLGTLFVSITADMAYLIRTQIELCYSISVAYDVEMDMEELKAVTVALLGFSGSAEAVKGVAARSLRSVIDELTRVYISKGIPDSAAEISARLLPRYAGRAYKVLPFLGMPLSASINITSTMMVGNQARKYFSTWDDFPESAG